MVKTMGSRMGGTRWTGAIGGGLVALLGLAACTPKPAPLQAAVREGGAGPAGAAGTTPTVQTVQTVTVKEAPAPDAGAAPSPVTGEKRDVQTFGSVGAGGHPALTHIKVGGGAIPPSPASELTAFLEKRVPKGGTVEAGDRPLVRHTVQAGESASSIAAAYLELSEIYAASELAAAIAKKNPGGVAVGKTIDIPSVTTRVLRDPKEERFGWPADKILRGVFVTGTYASIRWVDTLDRAAAHGLNAVVLDGKDYEGYVNYPSKAKIAVETKAIRAYVPDLARAIRFAHWRGIHVIVRIPCFHDPWADKHATDARLSIKFTPTGKPIHVDWLDPANAEAQDYAIELAQEALDAGADEIQLDYVRFPVHLAMKVAVLPQPVERKIVIRDFVRRVKKVTAAANAGLSLDFFGVAATGDPSDIEALGQDIATVATEADAISLMSYPSHYSKGFNGWPEPADHPEIIAMGNKAAVDKIKPTGAATVWRTWLQAFPLRVTNYGSAYVVAQAKHAEASGGHGWLMWSPGCEYSAVWGGFPVVKKDVSVAASAPATGTAGTPSPSTSTPK
jgi:hypothetical protein